MTSAFGRRLRSARLSEGLSQQELAEKVGVQQGSVSHWEVGRVKPLSAQLKKLETVLGQLGAQKPLAEVPGGEKTSTGAFGAWLRKARSSAGMSVPELAETSGLSAMAVYNIESGRILNPRSETKARLARALKKDVPPEVNEEAKEEQEIEGLGSLTDFDPHDKNDRPSGPGVYVFYDVSDRPVYVEKVARTLPKE